MHFEHRVSRICFRVRVTQVQLGLARPARLSPFFFSYSRIPSSPANQLSKDKKQPTMSTHRQMSMTATSGSDGSSRRSPHPGGIDAPINHLPPEIVALVLQFVDTPTAASALHLTHVCASWRKVALQTPSLWRDVRAISFRRKVARPSLARHDLAHHDSRAISLLSHWSELSNDTVTHANFLSARIKVDFRTTMAFIKHWSSTLEDLAVGNADLCQCDDCFRLKDTTIDPHAVGSYAVATDSVLDLFARTPNLRRLTLALSLSEGPWCWPKSCVAQPGQFALIRSECHDGYRVRKVKERLFAFLDHLPSAVDRFAFHSAVTDETWGQWTYSVLFRRAEHLRSVAIPLHEESLPLLPVIDLPLLEEATLAPALDPEEATLSSGPWRCRAHCPVEWPRAMARPVWFQMPLLHTICTFPEAASKTFSPLVKRAFLLMQYSEDIDTLPQILAAWPHLETLTLWVEQANRYDSYWPWPGSAMIQKCVELLTPSISGAAVAPELRHLGFFCPSWAGFQEGIHLDPQWAARPWCSNDDQYWRSRYIDAQGEDLRPVLGDGIVRLEAERRALHEGRELPAKPNQEPQSLERERTSDGRAPAAMVSAGNYEHRRCRALEVIKLGGVRVPDAVRQRLAQNSKVRLTTYEADGRPMRQ